MQKSWERLRQRYIKPIFHKLNPWRQVTYGDVRVHYRQHLDGGGTYFGQDFVPYLELRHMPRQQRVFEWCAGPGFIGFSIARARPR